MSVRFDLMRGVGDRSTSGGVDNTAALAGKIPNVVVGGVWNWYQWRDLLADISRLPQGTLRAILGYSMGGNEVTQVASDLASYNIPIDLLLAEDPTVWSAMYPLHKNVKRAICWHNNRILNIVGMAHVSSAPDFVGHLEEIELNEAHMSVDWDQAILRRVLNELTALANAPPAAP